ncbi:MAG: diaminopimelate epimerase [Thermoleophilia bacterium]|nr:diaminopimelate epimerase [Thermoleophilia bacterium]
MRVAKWQGLGNDYIIVEESELPAPLTAEAIALLCDRHRGIGSDGILVFCPPTGAVSEAVARMRVLNPDGSEAEMCGNGVRMFARYLERRSVVKTARFTIETLAGPIEVEIKPDGGVRVDMGWARFRSDNVAVDGFGDVVDRLLEIPARRYQFTFVDVGNPHCVIFVDDPNQVDLSAVGPAIEHHEFFPNRTNVEFVQLEDTTTARVRVWERGAGETQACGTGATAVAAACVRRGVGESPMTVCLPGGDLLIEVYPTDSHDGGDVSSYRVFMTGPAQEVFTAELSPELLANLGWWLDGRADI